MWLLRVKRLVCMLLALVILVLGLRLFSENCKNALASGSNDGTGISRDELIEDAFYPSDYSGYDYPVLPGTTMWPYGSFSQMVDICTVPQERLAGMTTDELLQTVLVNPIVLMVYAYDNLESGYETVKGYCNSLDELCHRQDRVECLYDYLENHANYFSTVESMGDEYLDYLMNRRKTVFLMLAENEDFFSGSITSIESAREYINQILERESRLSSLQEPLRDPSPLTFHRIVNTPIVASNVPLTTPKQQPMYGYVFSVTEEWLYSDGMYRIRQFSDISSAGKTSLANEIYGLFGIYPENNHGASVKYNCHAYAWCNASDRYNYWVNYFNAQGYTETTIANVNVGGNVVYYDSYGNTAGSNTPYTHSAVVATITYHTGYSLTLKSKWGAYGLYTHSVSNCPYYYYQGSSNVSDRKYFNP